MQDKQKAVSIHFIWDQMHVHFLSKVLSQNIQNYQSIFMSKIGSRSFYYRRRTVKSEILRPQSRCIKIITNNMSRVVRKPALCMCEN